MLRALTDAVRNDAAQNMLNLFIELAKKEPRFFRRQLVDVVSDMFEIAEDKSVKEKTKHLAVEFVLTLVEAKKKAPGMMKKLPFFTNRCFAMILKLLLDIEDEPSWYSTDTEHEYAGETVECLERFSAALGGKTIASIAMEQLEAYFDSLEWEKRHAALREFYQIAEGSWKVMIKYLEKIVYAVLHSCQDPHPRVRWAAMVTIEQLSDDFHWEWQEEYHNQLVPVIVAAMDDFPRVQIAAACALRQFFNPDMPETLVPYLDQILNKLLVLLQNDDQMVQKAAIEALIDIAEFSNEHFKNFYDFVMPDLKSILVNANEKSNHKLRSIASQCIRNVGLAVGKEKFRADLEKVMEVLKPLQESGTNIHILKACHSICKCIGKEFLPYMSTVMPLLVEYAQLEIDKDLDDECDDSECNPQPVPFTLSVILTANSAATSYPECIVAAEVCNPFMIFLHKPQSNCGVVFLLLHPQPIVLYSRLLPPSVEPAYPHPFIQ
ncbi:importin subunit beta-3-like [Solanum tuberosum]|uniref:importin subunit beta-3-like n=1 Tax=Solanum tuberosum TaxID=4113 RepID=UPI00073A4882|nr:PREDICTED: importin subunit beta-3-like [Solanum tuberosum]